MKKTLLQPPSNFSNLFFKFLFAILLSIGCSLSSKAQVATNYTYAESAGSATYTDLTTGTVIATSAVTNFNSIPALSAYTLPSPSYFYFNNLAVSKIYVSDNGFITLGTAASTVANAAPINTMATPISDATVYTATNYIGAISGFGTNLGSNTTSAGEVKYDLLGSSPNRVFVVQYKNMHRYNGLYTNGQINMQIRFYETTGVVEVLFRDAFTSTSASSIGGQVGLKGLTNTFATDVLNRVTPATNIWPSSDPGIANTSVLLTQGINPAGGVVTGFKALSKLVWTPCFSPSAITAVAQADLTTVDIGWTAPTVVPGTGYDWKITTDAGGTTIANAGAATGTGVIGNTVSYTGLSTGVNYYFFVKSNCKSTWVALAAPLNIPCVNKTIPYTQNFEASAVPSIPNCNSRVMVSGANFITVNNTATAYYGFNSKNLITSGALAQDTWFFTQAINVTAADLLVSGGSFKLSYKYGSTREQAFFVQKMKVAFGTVASVAGMTTTLADHNQIKTSPNTNVVNFNISAPGTYYIGFNGYASATQGYLQLDDIVLDYASCFAPTALNSGQITSSSALITWTSPATPPASGYEYYYTPVTGTTATAGAFGIGNNYTILTVGTTDYTLIGASANTVGTIFQATGVGAGTGTAQLITTAAATTTVVGNVYQVIAIGTTNFTTIGGANTVGTFFTATGVGAGTGLVRLITQPLSTQTASGTTAAAVIIANLSGLTSSTSYYYWTRSSCGSGDISPWSVPNIFTTTPIITYCTPSGATFSQDPSGITNVTMGSINNTTGIETSNYGNYTSLSTNVAQTATVPVSITFNTGFTYDTAIWVDWNNDGDFVDLGESVYTLTLGTGTAPKPTIISASFVVPTLDSNSNNTLGPHRLRIGSIDSPTFTGGALAPCRNGQYQAFEDYSIYVTVTPPALTLTDGIPLSTSNTICEGDDTSGAPVSLSSVATDYQVYTWSPTNGVTGNIATGSVVFNPIVTTTYILTATQTSGNFSSNTASYTINVNPKPSPITITPSAPTICQSDTAYQPLVATGGVVQGILTDVLFEDFNNATTTFTTVNGSTNGVPANAAWTLSPSPTLGITSPDNSQFYFSNSDSQGSAGTTLTELISPVFGLATYTDAALSFSHYYKQYTNGSAKVEISTNGGSTYTTLPGCTWTTTSQGTATNFANVSVDLTAYVGQTNLVIRFIYSANWGYYWAVDNVRVYGSNTSLITWSPSTGLYLDSLGATPYAGETVSTVYAKPGATTTYTAEASSLVGCSTDKTVVVTVTPIVAGSILSGNQSVCNLGSITDLVLTGYSGTISGWQHSTSPTFASAITNIASSASATLTAAQIAATITTGPRYFRAVITNASCTTYSNIITITINKTSWLPGWSNGAPNSGTAVEFKADWTGGSLSACSVIVTSGNVSFAAGQTLTVENEVKVNGGTLTFADTASLYQVANITNPSSGDTPYSGKNTGVITYTRKTGFLRLYDYTYWSSPVYATSLAALSPGTPYLGYYQWDATAATPNWSWINPISVMEACRGYIIRSPDTFVAPAIFTGNFSGTPNNGTLTYPMKGGAVLNLIGNPYPSAIDAYKFLTDGANGGFDGTLYFWTHNTDIDLTGNYTPADYSSYTTLGGLPSASGGQAPTGHIGSGVAFFVHGGVSDGMVTFNNDMREAAANTQFFKTNNSIVSQDTSDTSGVEKHRYWLEMTNTDGAYKGILVGYAEGATMGLDRLFDGEMLDVGGVVNMYTMVAPKKLGIQGRPLPFDTNDTVPVGYKSTVNGTFTITLTNFDGLFMDQDIYLEDKLLNVIHNLKTSNYSFTTEIGTFEDRFVLRYTDSSLGIDNPNFDENSVIVYHNTKGLHINSGTVSIKNVTIFDIQGRQIAVKIGVNSTETVFTTLPNTNQVLLVKIEAEDGKTVTKKVVY